MAAEVDVLVFGSGSLTRSLVMAVASRIGRSLSITLAARNKAAAESIALLARARATALGGTLSIGVQGCDYSSSGLTQLFRVVRPRTIVMLASRQSPWQMTSRWRRLVAAAGYGFTLPLQASLADTVFRVARDHHRSAVLVNGCYPDMVNSVLLNRGISVAAGIGNIAILISLIKASYPASKLGVLAHHAHVAALIKGQWDGLAPPVIWVNDKQMPAEEAARLIRFSLPGDDTLNQVTGATAVPMLEALAGLSPAWEGHAPGVGGLPGGYPVLANNNGVSLMLPGGVSLSDAQQRNRDFGRFDGVVDDGDLYRLTKSVDQIQLATGVRIPERLLSWRAGSLEEQANRLEVFRAEIDALQS